MRETQALNASGYLVKPVNPTEFISLVRRIEAFLTGAGDLPTREFADVDSVELSARGSRTALS